MFSGSFYKNILVNDSFGKSATNIYGLFSYCLYLESIDLRSFDTSKITNFENALQNLERLERFIVGDSWNLTMNECGLPEPEQYPWVDSFGNVYNIKAVPQPNVLYKQLMMSQLSTNDSDGQLSNSNNNIAEDDEIIDPEINNVPMIDEQTGADDAAALVGAGVPLALGLTFAKRRIRGKHVKIK